MTAFPFIEYWWMYLAFTGLVVFLLQLDLSLHHTEEVPTLRQAGAWTVIWISLAVAFCLGLYFVASFVYSSAVGRRLSLEYLTGYVVEESLSVDNMFVFALVFRYFAVPPRFQHRVLFYGVLGAILFRGVFIAAGATLLRFAWALPAFGAFLMISGIRLVFGRETHPDPTNSRTLRVLRRFLPVTNELHGARFFVSMNGAIHATRLLVVLLFLESTDIVFATDSVPAVFGITREPFVVYSSNIFAVLGLRALFGVLSGALERFHLLKHGLAIVLIFIGTKMALLDRMFGGRFPVGASLTIICTVITVAVGLSLAFPKSKNIKWPGIVVSATEAITGAAFVSLAAAGAWYAADPAGGPIRLPGLAAVGSSPLVLSSICAAFCGILLLSGAARQKR